MVVRVQQRAESLWTRVALRRVASTCHMISNPISMKTTRGYQTPATKTVLTDSSLCTCSFQHRLLNRRIHNYMRTPTACISSGRLRASHTSDTACK